MQTLRLPRLTRWAFLLAGGLLSVVLGVGPAVAEAPPKTPDGSFGPIPGVPGVPTGGMGGPNAPGMLLGPQGEGFSGKAGGSGSFGQIGEDYYLSFDLFSELSIGPVTLGLWVPLRFRMIDEAPKDGKGFHLRGADWDEVSDYFRILRFVEVNVGGDSWRLRGRLGALDGESIGHGTVLGRYYNSLDPDHWQPGLLLDTAFEYGGLEFLLDNVTDPELFGIRLHVRPAAFFTDNELARRLAVGLSYIADTNAPVRLRDASLGNGTWDPLFDDGNVQVAGTDTLSVFGIDVEYTVLDTEVLKLVPYIDLNFMFDDGEAGHGLHLGAFFDVNVPGPVGPTFMTRLEYRNLGEGYAPVYFDSLYEVQRLQYDAANLRSPGDDIPLTKLGWLRQGTSGRHGWLGQLVVDVGGWVQVGMIYEDYDGPNNTALTLSLVLPKLPVVKVGAYYTRRGFDGLDEAFELDGALFVAFLQAQLAGPLVANATYTRTWHVQEDGSYRAQGDWSVGVGVAFDL